MKDKSYAAQFTQLARLAYKRTSKGDRKRLFRILSLDGGGIRGLMTAQVLVFLEEKLNQKYEKRFGKPEKPKKLGEFFDLVAGTSTGGILTCAFLTPDTEGSNVPLYSAKDCVNIYYEHGATIFTKTFWGSVPLLTGLGGSKYDSQNIENVLDKYFKNYKLSNLVAPCLITSYDIEQRKAVFFTSHDARQKGNMADFRVRDVARSTSAAPTFFPPSAIESDIQFPYHLIDGALFANNPTMCALVEAIKVAKLNPSDMIVLSLGTGSVQKHYKYDQAKNWGLVGWVSPIIDIMMSAASETVDYQMKKLYQTLNKKEHYLRIMPDLGQASPEMDDVSPENLEHLKNAGTACAIAFDDELERFADLLLDNQALIFGKDEDLEPADDDDAHEVPL